MDNGEQRRRVKGKILKFITLMKHTEEQKIMSFLTMLSNFQSCLIFFSQTLIAFKIYFSLHLLFFRQLLNFALHLTKKKFAAN